MNKLILTEKRKVHDKDAFFCRFCDAREQEVVVFASAQCLKDFNKKFPWANLEKVCCHAAEFAIENGSYGPVEIVGEVYRAVKKRLGADKESF